MFSLGFKYGKECEENNILNSFLKLCEIKNTNLTINEATIAIEKEEKLIINEKNRLSLEIYKPYDSFMFIFYYTKSVPSIFVYQM